MKTVGGVAAMLAGLWFLHHAFDHGSFWEGFAALCTCTVGGLMALGARL